MTQRQQTLLRLGLLSALALVGVAWWLVNGSTEPASAPEAMEEREPPRTYMVAEPVKPVPERHVIAVETAAYEPCGGRSKVHAKPQALSPDLVQAARKYFDQNEDLWVGHKAFRNALQQLARNHGRQVLAHPPTLRRLVAQSRSFEPQLDDRKWILSQEIEHIDHGASGFERKGGKGADKVWMHVREPKSYPKRNRDFDKPVRVDPYPTLMILHTQSDTWEGDGVGKIALERVYPKSTFPEIEANWISMVPIADSAAYVKDGVIRRSRVLDPLRMLWNHYHVDFDRVVLDGGTDALTLLGSSASFFAGGVIRGASLDTPKLRASVGNYEHVPLCVVGDPDLARQLRAAGHPDVSEVGSPKDPALRTWLTNRCRVQPRSFVWNIIEGDQSLAYWVNVDKANWSSDAERVLRVRCIDTTEHPNTIFVQCVGLQEVSFFLSDDVVDLDRPVRIVINDRLVETATLKVPEHQIPLSRDTQTLFLHETLDVRKSRYYGWLMGLVVTRVEVPEPPRDAGIQTSVAPEPAATPRQAAQAGKLLSKAKKSHAAGNHKEARRLLDRALWLPTSVFTEEIRALREALSNRVRLLDEVPERRSQAAEAGR